MPKAPGSTGLRGVRLNPQHDDRTRAKIQTTQIVKRLTQFVNGEVELQPAQVTAALGLLRKTLPDLTQVSGTMNVSRDLEDMSDAELTAIAAGRSAGTPQEEEGPAQSDPLH